MRRDSAMKDLMVEFRNYQRSIISEQLNKSGNIVIPMPDSVGGGNITLKCDGPMISKDTFHILGTKYLMPAIMKELAKHRLSKANMKRIREFLYGAIVTKGEDKLGPDQAAKDFITGRESYKIPKNLGDQKGFGGLLNPSNWQTITGVSVNVLHSAINAGVTDFFNSGITEQIIDNVIAKIKSAAAGKFEISNEALESMKANLVTLPTMLAARFLKNTKLVHSMFAALVDGKRGVLNKNLKSLEARVLTTWFDTNEGKRFIDSMLRDILRSTIFSMKIGKIKEDALQGIRQLTAKGSADGIPPGLLVSMFVWSELRQFRKDAGDDEPVFQGNPMGAGKGSSIAPGIQKTSDKIIAKIQKNGICSIAQVYQNFSKISENLNFWSLVKTFKPLLQSLEKENPWLKKVMRGLDKLKTQEGMKEILGSPDEAKDYLASLGVTGKGVAPIMTIMGYGPSGPGGQDPTTMIA